MSCPRYMISFEVQGNKRYCAKLKTKPGNHKQLQEEMELWCLNNKFEQISKEYSKYCGGDDKIVENWQKSYNSFFPDYRSEEEEKARKEGVDKLLENNTKEKLAELLYYQNQLNKRLREITNGTSECKE